MKQEEIDKRNKAIAIYRGLLPRKSLSHVTLDCHEWGMLSINVSDLTYHKNWEDLMPVVEKINATKISVSSDTGVTERLRIIISPDGVSLDSVVNNEFSMRKLMRTNGITMLDNTWLVVSDYCLSQQTT